MAVIHIPEWRPDLPDLENPGSPLIRNLVPKSALSYGPWKRPVVLSSNALDSRCLGMFSGADYSGNIFTFAGDEGKLYRYSAATFTDVSKLGGYTTAAVYYDAVSRAWYFEQYNDLAIATNYSDAIQVWTMGTSSAFADLASSAPKAKYLATVGDFLVAANTDDAFDGAVPLRLWWSPIGAPETDDWGNTNLQSDFRTLPKGKRITGIVGGEYGLIFTEAGVYRMTYSGPPTIFSIDQINVDHGCVAPGTIATMENMVFYLAEDGFQVMVDGQNTHIGSEKVDNYFSDNIDPGYLERAVATIDDARKLYIVSFPSVGSSTGTPDKHMLYNYNIQRWAYAEGDEIAIIDALQSEALTVEALGAIYPVVEDIPGSIDSASFSGGTDFLAGFNTSHELVEFSGDNADFDAETPEMNLITGRKAILRNIRPIADCSCLVVSIGTRNHIKEVVSYSAEDAPHSETGLCSFRERARYHRAALRAPEGWTGTFVQGVDSAIEYTDAGKR